MQEETIPCKLVPFSRLAVGHKFIHPADMERNITPVLIKLEPGDEEPHNAGWLNETSFLTIKPDELVRPVIC